MLSNSKPKWDVQSEVRWSCFIYPPPPCFCLSHSCVSYVHEAPGSVRHQKGNICNSSAPPGQAVLTGRWCVQCTQWGYAKNIDMGGQDRQTERGWRGKNVPPPSPVLTPRPHTVSFEGQFTLKYVLLYRLWACLVRPPSTELHPPPRIYGPSKDYCLLLSEATREININLTSDRMLWAPKLRYRGSWRQHQFLTRH